jgi:putative DNA primase/helicase
MSNVTKLAALQKNARGGGPSEEGAAQFFKEKYQDRFRYDQDRGAWFEWTGSHWAIEPTGLVLDLVRETVKQLAAADDEKARRSAGRYAFASGVEKYCRVNRAFAVRSDIWDRDPFLLGTPNGAVDLRTGELRDADPSDHISKVTAVAPDAEAECPRWRQFLEEATCGDQGMIKFLQQWAGYSLTGDTREHALVFVHGQGGNGKGVWLSTITKIMRDYASIAAMDTFTSSGFDRHPTELAMLAGARMVTASETEKGKAWAEARIKSMTGGDAITAHFMRQDNFTFMPAFKLMIIGNHKPALHNVDDAMKRRLRIVPFIHKPAVANLELVNELQEEWPGILRWMIEGSLDWQQNGLTTTAAIAEATDEYFGDQDLCSQWIDECIDAEPGNSFKTATSTELFQSWTKFTKDAGEPAGTSTSFAELLKARGFTKDRTNKPLLERHPPQGHRGSRRQLSTPKVTSGDTL